VDVHFFANFPDNFSTEVGRNPFLLIIFQKKVSTKEKGFYPPLLRNCLESWQKSEHPLCKVIASQKDLPVNFSKKEKKLPTFLLG
jgi:hypothetical protein